MGNGSELSGTERKMVVRAFDELIVAVLPLDSKEGGFVISARMKRVDRVSAVDEHESAIFAVFGDRRLPEEEYRAYVRDSRQLAEMIQDIVDKATTHGNLRTI